MTYSPIDHFSLIEFLNKFLFVQLSDIRCTSSTELILIYLVLRSRYVLKASFPVA